MAVIKDTYELDKIRRRLQETGEPPWQGAAGGMIRDADSIPVVSAIHTSPANAQLIVNAPVDIRNLLDTVDDLLLRLARYEARLVTHRYTDEMLDEADRRHNKNMESLASIARDLGCNRKTLAEKMKEANIPVRDQRQSQGPRRVRERGGMGADLKAADVAELSGTLLRTGNPLKSK